MLLSLGCTKIYIVVRYRLVYSKNVKHLTRRHFQNVLSIESLQIECILNSILE